MRRKTLLQAPEEKALLSLVQGRPLAPDLSACDPQALQALASRHLVLFPLASRVGSEDGVPPSWSVWAAGITLSSTRDARRVSRALAKTAGLLGTIGLAPVVLKGPSLSLGNPRDFADADLLIPEESLLPAIACLEAAGYRYQGHLRNGYLRRSEHRDWGRLARWANQYEFTEPETGTLVELHTAFFESGRVYDEDLRGLRAAVGRFTADAVPDPVTGLRFLSLEDRVVLLALQAGLKRAPVERAFVLRHLLDLDNLAAAGPDWSRVSARAGEVSASHHLLFLLLLHGRFVDPDRFQGPRSDLEARMPRGAVRLVRRHLAGLRGPGDYDTRALFEYRLLAPFWFHGTAAARFRSLTVVSLLVPFPLEMAALYGLPPRSPLVPFCYLLEPLRFLVRGFRFLLRKLTGVR